MLLQGRGHGGVNVGQFLDEQLAQRHYVGILTIERQHGGAFVPVRHGCRLG